MKKIIKVVAFILFVTAVIVLIFMMRGKFSGLGGNVDNQQTEQATQGNKITLTADTRTTYNQTGTAYISEENGKLKVVLEMTTHGELAAPQPAHIHSGACPDVASVIYPLNPVVDGKSETILENATLDSLKSILNNMTAAVNIHKSEAESSIYTSCGDIVLN